MKIILEGTEAEFRSALHSFGISQETVTVERTFAELKVILKNHLNDFWGTDKTKRPQPIRFNVGFIPDSDSDKIKALAKDHADRRRQVREQLNSLSNQDIPEAVVNYFNGNKLSVSFEKR